MTTRDRVLRAASSALLLLSSAGCEAPVPSVTAGTPADDPEPADLVWPSARGIEQNDRTTALELSLVRGDGSVAWSGRLDLDPDAPGAGIAFLAGPHAGRLAYGLATEMGATVLRADAHEGAAAEIATIEGLVHGAALSPDGAVLYLVVEAAARLEIQRLALDPRAIAEHVAFVPAAAGPDFAITPQRGLMTTPNGEYLLLERCDPAGRCNWFELAVASGATRELETVGAGRLIDLSNDLLLTAATDCDTGPCPYVIVDRESGAGVAWDPGAHNARLVANPEGGSVLVYDTAGTGGAVRISLVDPATFEERPLDPIDEPGLELGLAREGQDDWAPPGWLVLVGPGLNLGEQGGPVLVNVLDERVVRLSAPEPP